MHDYDAIPYESTPIADAHPYKLAALGQLLGLTPPPPATSRILELGCAEGGTLIPLARLFPSAELLGLELSAGQTNSGNAVISALALRNVRIQCANILDVGRELGQFDYIIAHGVYSWVPAHVQTKMLALCRDLLTPQGLAYVSYNVNPGWRLRGALRDMFAYHLRNATTPQDKLSGAYQLIELMEQGLGEAQTLMANYLRQELAHLRTARAAYLYHEYLEAVNEPILFTEFLGRLEPHALRYVCDAELFTLFPSSYGANGAAMLEQFADLETIEQYADFLQMRTFRQSVICHAQQTPEYEIDLQSLDRLAAYSNLTATKSPELQRVRTDNFSTVLGKTFPVNHPLTKASLLYLEAVYPDAIALPELLVIAQDTLKQQHADNLAGEVNTWRGEIFNLFANSLIGLATEPRHFPTSLGSITATPFAQLQTKRRDGFISTTWSETLSLDAFSARLLQLLDGSRDKTLIITQLLAEMQKDKPRTTRVEIEHNVDRLLRMFAKNGVLQPAV